MKKIFKSFLAIVLCVLTLCIFTGCDDGVWSKTTVDTSKVSSNGGVTVYHDGWIYFINGTKTNSEANNQPGVVQGGIYRVKTDSNGEIIYKTDSEGKKTTEFEKIEKVVDRFAGYKDGSLYIFGDYLYYTTPSRDKDKSGSMLVGITEFRRYDLVNKKDQLLYQVNQSDETITFNFYKEGEKLDLVIFEQKSGTLKSLRISDKVTTLFTKTNVKSVLFSDNYGVNKTTDSFGDNYIYFTLSYEEDSLIQRGVRVYKILPDGTMETKISEGKDVSLLTIRSGRLIYAYNSYVYFSNISKGADTLEFEEDNIVCYKNYEDIIFLEDANNSVLVYDGSVLRVISWSDGTLESEEIYNIKADGIDFISVNDNYVYYLNNKVLYKCRYKEFEGDEGKRPVQLSTTKIDTASGLISAEYNSGYIYGMYTDTSKSLTYLYRVNILTPEERGETDDNGGFKDVDEAEFIGVKE